MEINKSLFPREDLSSESFLNGMEAYRRQLLQEKLLWIRHFPQNQYYNLSPMPKITSPNSTAFRVKK
jgi:hypothetical protein